MGATLRPLTRRCPQRTPVNERLSLSLVVARSILAFVKFLRSLLLTFVLALVVALVGCKDRAAQTDGSYVMPTVRDTSTDLVLTWIDEHGEFRVEQKVADVPAEAREVVRVSDPGKEPPQRSDVFVADLRSANPDGTYPVRTIGRAEFEKVALSRRQKDAGVLTARAADTAPPVAHRPVIIYGASWCGPCHQAAAYFKQRGVPFVEKDIERDGAAAREMQTKLASAGVRGGSIPVIDVRGKVLVGFDARALDRALSQTM